MFPLVTSEYPGMCGVKREDNKKPSYLTIIVLDNEVAINTIPFGNIHE